MILEHGSCGSMVDAMTRPKQQARGGDSSDEEDEKKDEQDFHNNNNNNNNTDATSVGRQHCSLGEQPGTPRETKTTTGSLPPTPFFIMEWLNEVNPEDLELARKLLQTPNDKQHQQHHHHHQSPHRQHSSMGALGAFSKQEEEEDDSSIKKDLFAAAAAAASSPHRSASTGQLRSSTQTLTYGSSMSLSSFHKRSVLIGNGWNAKGLSKAQIGRWRDALSCWENALEIRKQVLGDEHVDTANTYNNIGIALGKLNRVHEAISSLQMALEIRSNNMMMMMVEQDQRQQQQLRVQQVAATLHNLANVHQQAGDLKMAMANLEKSIDLLLKQQQQQQPLVDDHDDNEHHDSVHLARAHVALGHVYYEAQQLHKAQQSYRQGLEILMQRCSHAEADQYCEAEIESIQTDLDEIAELLRCNSSSNDEAALPQEDDDEEKENDEQEEETDS
jgi:tetratricopeptide (TPR) repeat protein